MILRGIIDAESDMMVVGHARNGYEAVNMTQVLRPDLITMDIRMPFMDGFDAIEKIMIVQPTPIIVVSAKVNDEQLRITFNAIKLGALAVVEKPENITQDGFEHMRSRLVQTIRLMAEIKVVTHKTPRKVSRHEIPVVTDFKKSDKLDYKIVALGVSTGGPVALQTILSELPKNFPVPIVIVQHMSPGFLGGFIKWLQDDVILPISLAIDKEQLLPGHIYFAPDQKHLSIVEKGAVCLPPLRHRENRHHFVPLSMYCLNP